MVAQEMRRGRGTRFESGLAHNNPRKPEDNCVLCNTEEKRNHWTISFVTYHNRK